MDLQRDRRVAGNTAPWNPAGTSEISSSMSKCRPGEGSTMRAVLCPLGSLAIVSAAGAQEKTNQTVGLAINLAQTLTGELIDVMSAVPRPRW